MSPGGVVKVRGWAWHETDMGCLLPVFFLLFCKRESSPSRLAAPTTQAFTWVLEVLRLTTSRKLIRSGRELISLLDGRAPIFIRWQLYLIICKQEEPPRDQLAGYSSLLVAWEDSSRRRVYVRQPLCFLCGYPVPICFLVCIKFWWTVSSWGVASFWGQIGGDVTSNTPPPKNRLWSGGQECSLRPHFHQPTLGCVPSGHIPLVVGLVQEVPVSCLDQVKPRKDWQMRSGPTRPNVPRYSNDSSTRFFLLFFFVLLLRCVLPGAADAWSVRGQIGGDITSSAPPPMNSLWGGGQECGLRPHFHQSTLGCVPSGHIPLVVGLVGS